MPTVTGAAIYNIVAPPLFLTVIPAVPFIPDENLMVAGPGVGFGKTEISDRVMETTASREG